MLLRVRADARDVPATRGAPVNPCEVRTTVPLEDVPFYPCAKCEEEVTS